ncbi:MAG: hypothetical protein LBT92_03345 [Rickettsiales bacterium]|jgi:myo-inositol-1(or 4)-monophosphatase|nr:hypothetical protein [Rickettsiales bacterium]
MDAFVNMSANLAVMAAALEGAGRLLMRDFGEIEQLQSSVGAAEKFAAVSYSKVEKAVIASLAEARPKFGLVAPGGREARGSDISHRFIFNPMDGMEFFSRGIPAFAMTLALQRQKEVIAATVYNPLSDRMAYAEKGGGAMLRESRMTRRIRVSKRTSGGMFASGRSAVFGPDSIALSYLACGAIDGYVGRGRDVFAVAAGLLVAREAGAMVRAFSADGMPAQSYLDADVIIAENNSLQPTLADIIMKKGAK